MSSDTPSVSSYTPPNPPLVPEPPPDSVINLSTFQLSDNHILVLQKGLSFCPTPTEPDVGQIFRGLDRFFRNLRVTTFWDQPRTWLPHTSDSQNSLASTPSDDEEDFPQSLLGNMMSPLPEPFDLSKFRNPSTWDPKQIGIGPLDAFCRAVKTDIDRHPPQELQQT